MAHSYVNLDASIGAAAWARTDNVKNTVAAGAPGVSDDSTAKYEEFSRWLDVTGAPDIWECTDPSPGAAVWIKIYPAPSTPGPQGIPGITVPGEPGEDGEDGYPIPGIPGRDSTVPGPPGAASIVPGPPGMSGDDAEDPIIIPGQRGVQGIPGMSIPGTPGEDGDDGFPIPGNSGRDSTVPGPASIVPGPPGMSGDDAEDPIIIPGQRGLPGAPGLTIPGTDGLDGEDAFPIPGNPGRDSTVPGPAGAAGAAGIGVPGQPGEDGDDGGTSFVAPNPSATPADMRAGTNSAAFVSPARQQLHISAVKAWVHFGYSISVNVYASYNISSITRNAVGDYTVNFTTPFANALYAVSGCLASNSAVTIRGFMFPYDDGTTPTTSAMRIAFKQDGAGLIDPAGARLIFAGDQ